MALGGWLAACGGADDSPKGGPSFDEGVNPPDFADAGSWSPNAVFDSGVPLPPEREERLDFQAPQAGRSSVYVPNPSTHRVAVVNASTFAVESISAGLGPTYAATVPGQDVAVVINVASRDVAILRTEEQRTVSQRFALTHDPNAIAIAPDGKHAVVYLDAQSGGTTSRSFQDVSVLSLVAGDERARGVSVGFRPKGVQFSGDGTRAFVVTEDGISIIDLLASDKGPTIAKLVPLGDGLDGPQSVDVQVVASGSHALTRRDDGTLRLIDLTTGQLTRLDLSPLQQSAPALLDGGVDAGADGGLTDASIDASSRDGGSAQPLPSGQLDISDLDVSPDGAFALAVVRNAGALLRIPLPAGFNDPRLIDVVKVDDVLVGSVQMSRKGNVAALFTTAVPVEALVLLDLTRASPPKVVRLRKAVRAVALSSNGTHALVLHSPTAAASNADEDEARIRTSEGYSLVEVASGFPKLQLTPAAIRERDLLITPDESHLFALLRSNTGVQELQVADLASFEVKTTPLAKPPSSIGMVPDAERVFIGQVSEGGMITFVNSRSGEVVHAVSGFELSGRVRQ